jgi:hypothetical protein
VRAILVLALFAVACGGSGKRHTTVSLSGSSGNLNAVACGKQEPFEHYAAPAQVHYTGNVSPAPSGRWKVKVKLKQCRGGSFVDATSQKIVGQAGGRFDGVFAVTAPGSYSVEAKFEGSNSPESDKVYLQVK